MATNSTSTNGTSTNGISTGAFIYYGIKLVCVSLGKRYSFPFAGAAVAIAVVRA